MKKYIKIILIALILLVSIGYAQAVSASIVITNIEIYDLSNGNAKLQWRTDEPAKGIVYYGLEADNLDYYVKYNGYDYFHTTPLSGLEDDDTYYYKIVAENRDGIQIESFIQNFSTKNMKDTVAPVFLDKKVLQTTANATAIYWKTDEKTKATVYYGADIEDLKKKKSYGSYDINHTMYLYDLDFKKEYYIRIEAKDKDGNITTRSLITNTNGPTRDGSQLTIYNIEPSSYNSNLISAESAIIKWDTSLVCRSSISYGTKSGSYGKTKDVNDKDYQLSHQILLSDLKPNTTYFYKINATNCLYNKSKKSEEYSFATIPLQKVLGTKIVTNGGADTDNDGLSDVREASLGTDPSDNDTDNDGYNDGIEVANNYNPKGYGRLASQVYANSNILNTFEKNKANELKSLVEQKIGKVNIDYRSWFVLSNAYIHGGYAVRDIVQAIKFSGKTVHPTIPLSAWKNTSHYLEYINK